MIFSLSRASDIFHSDEKVEVEVNTIEDLRDVIAKYDKSNPNHVDGRSPKHPAIVSFYSNTIDIYDDYIE